MISGLDHVQLAAPAGSEDALRAYYAGVLGMTELDKPEALRGRGGCWFSAGSCVLHLGIEHASADRSDWTFQPARKAHPGILVTGIDSFAARLARHGAGVEWDDNLPGHRRFYSHDPVGNRLEFLEPTA
jgi:catechol 2,3-dioxygenase-like lactoylglutathione lyase family enzyme